ncbi:MAG: tRNA (adenosine(37)-N6)-dimethylallyltransferase MiaA [Limisphaerales bacterium]
MKPIYLVGPTAVGKSAVAMELAGRISGEIISVDSMQVYRGLDIGTAKPSPAEQQQVSHHLIDVVELADPFDAAKFVALCSEIIAAVEARGNVPIFCGGTGLYLTAWLEGLGEAPPSDPELRESLEAKSMDELLPELREADPTTYNRIDRENPRRVVRALEVIRLTGRPFSEQRAAWTDSSGPEETVLCLARETDDLRRRIDARVDEMFEAGLVAETESLLERGLSESRAPMQAIGYRQVVEHLQGDRDLDNTITLIKTKTWQFARRQMTWFRNQLNATQIPLSPDDALTSVADRVLKLSQP